jgi:hypothetical protein
VTNSPPANVSTAPGGLPRGKAARVLASGIDSLVLALSLHWRDEKAFQLLADLKQSAKERGDEEPLRVEWDVDGTIERFRVQPHGKQGAEWLLVGPDYGLAIAKAMAPGQRPNAMVDIRSEALWTHGADAMVERIKKVLDGLGAFVELVKPSRLDLCVDLLIREKDWSAGLKDHFVTRARYISTHDSNRELSGFSIGRGVMSARLYDKPREIAEKSGKLWMFGVWGLPEVPPGHVIVRIECQVRRDVLREGRVNSWDDVRRKLRRLWAYCTQRWLRVVDDPKLHHTMQRLRPWWKVVQGGFEGAQQAWPLVREQAVNRDRRRLAAQTLGTLGSLLALSDDAELDEMAELDQLSALHAALAQARLWGKVSDAEFKRRQQLKRAKYRRPPMAFAGEPERQPLPAVESGDTPEGSA